MHSRRWSPAWVGFVGGTREMFRTLEQEGQTGWEGLVFLIGTGEIEMGGGRTYKAAS